MTDKLNTLQQLTVLSPCHQSTITYLAQSLNVISKYIHSATGTCESSTAERSFAYVQVHSTVNWYVARQNILNFNAWTCALYVPAMRTIYNVLCLHTMLNSIGWDRSTIFTSMFQHELIKSQVTCIYEHVSAWANKVTCIYEHVSAYNITS